MTGWTSNTTEPTPKITVMGWLRVALRGTVIGTVTFGGLILLLAIRLIERPLFGQARPITPHITQWVCRTALFVLGLRYTKVGDPITGQGAVVANHVSWLDIFTLNAAQKIYFVSKSEVAGWPGIGWLARATGTVFIARHRTQAAQHVQHIKDRLAQGHQLLFFPEGTSTDGLQVLAFKPTLFASFFDGDQQTDMRIQPVTVNYSAPSGADPRLYGWWGDMDFGPHLLTTLAQAPQGAVTVIYHPPVNVSDFENRKALAAHLETTVRAGHSNSQA